MIGLASLQDQSVGTTQRQNTGMENDNHTATLNKPRCFFVSRHSGAIEWAKQFPWSIDADFVTHLEIERLAPGDTVIGTLPVHLAAQVCARGGRYLHLSITLDAGQRGAELTAEQMGQAGACLVPYFVIQER